MARGTKIISTASQEIITLILISKPISRDTIFQVKVRKYFSSEPPLYSIMSLCQGAISVRSIVEIEKKRMAERCKFHVT